MPKTWKKGRGKLGVLDPLLGEWIADVSDVHPEAIGFEAQMPAGLARMVYWPDPEGGFRWAVESRNKQGWHRFTEHHYRDASANAKR